MSTAKAYEPLPMGQWVRLQQNDIHGYVKAGETCRFVNQPYYVGPDCYQVSMEKAGSSQLFAIRFASLPIKFEPLSEAEVAKLASQAVKEARKNPGQMGGIGAQMLMGTDPEIFAQTKGGELIPAFEWLQKERKEYPEEPYWDGFQAEFKTHPQTCCEALTDSIRHRLVTLRERLIAHDKFARLVAHDVMDVPQEVLKAAKKEHVQLGCAPSFNAYHMSGHSVPRPQELPQRFAGFHVHFSIDRAYHKLIPDAVKAMDNFAGIPSVAILQGLENPIRRQYYGLAGEYRTPSYGLEYRVLGAGVLWHPTLVHFHVPLARAALQFTIRGLQSLWEGSEEETLDIINNLNVDQAVVALKRNRDLMIALGHHMWGGTSMTPTPKTQVTRFYDSAILGGIRQHIDLDVKANWRLLPSDTWGQYNRGIGVQMRDFIKKHF